MAGSTEPMTEVTKPPLANAEEPGSETSLENKLADLTAKATAEYAVKHYSEAAEYYSQATEVQAEIRGDMAAENADLLYAYGKCLFYLAQQTSSVLGGTAASTQLSSSEGKPASKKRKTDAQSSKLQQAENSDTVSPTEKTLQPSNVDDVIPEGDVKTDTDNQTNKPLFQITGDENWDDSDEEEEEAEQDLEAEEEEEEDDFANAFELLDLARILYLRQLDQSQEETLDASDKGKYVASIDLTPRVKDIKRRIADIYDLQAEVSLEGEKYSAAVTDLQSCLALKEELEEPESSLLAECHYKLSLALEFSSQSQQRDADGNPVGDVVVDWAVRNEAIAQQEKAIDVCKLRVSKETAAMEKMDSGPVKDKAMAETEDVQDMIGEMDVRLAELRKPPISVKAETAMKEQVSGVLSGIFGASAEEQKEKLAEASKTANDLTGLVKRKKPKPQSNGGDSGFGSGASTPAPEVPMTKVQGKRKVAFADEAGPAESRADKRARVEDVEES